MASLLPSSVRRLIDAFASLPGIGPKSAQRLTFTLLKGKQDDLDQFASTLTELKRGTTFCAICHNIAEQDPCVICTDTSRDLSQVCVVEEVLDVIAIESTGAFKGRYHVLGGVISPIDNVGPEDLSINALERRVTESAGQIKELILAMNPSLEGEATALYLTKLFEPVELRLTRLARGLPTGGDLEYADHMTLIQALEGRRELKRA
ncbi:MAG: recombination protein RecR [Candidatus Doudnabacteria bacterium]|nr:recombination protein RecR [Candidatus Doudnabacteria bacterium]